MPVTHQTPNTVQRSGPRRNYLTYTWVVPTGTAEVSSHITFSPIAGNAMPRPTHHSLQAAKQRPVQVVFGVSMTGVSAPNSFLFRAEGTLDGPSIAPTNRNWYAMRGNASAPNVPLIGVTAGGIIEVLTPAAFYRFRVCGPTKPSEPITLTAMVYVGRDTRG